MAITEMKTPARVITVRLPAELHEKFRAACRRLYFSMNEIAVAAIAWASEEIATAAAEDVEKLFGLEAEQDATLTTEDPDEPR